MKTLRTAIFAFGLLSLLLLLSCAGQLSLILHMDTDLWDGSALGANLPGPPSQDHAENSEQVTLVGTCIDETIPGQCMRIGTQIDFIPGMEQQDPTAYSLTWRGVRPLAGNSANHTITFMDQSDNIAIRIVFDGSIGEWTVAGGDTSFPGHDFNGFAHEFSITMRPGIDQFDIQFEQNNCIAPDDCHDDQGLPFFDPDFDFLSRIRFEGEEYWLSQLYIYVTPAP